MSTTNKIRRFRRTISYCFILIDILFKLFYHVAYHFFFHFFFKRLIKVFKKSFSNVKKSLIFFLNLTTSFSTIKIKFN